MELNLSTPALLFPAVAILMLGFVNRYIGVAGVIRGFKKDYDSGLVHTDIVKQIKSLRTRIELLRVMLTIGIAALMAASVSMFLLFAGNQLAGKIAFGLTLMLMIMSMVFSMIETALSNKSLFVEIDDIIAKETRG